MATYTGVVNCDKSAEEVFAYLAAFEHTAEWDPSCDRAERVGDGEPAVGTRFTLYFKPGPVEMGLTYTITALEGGRRVQLTGGNRWLRSVDTITVEPLSDGARVVYDAKITLPGVLGLFDPLLGLGFHRAAEQAREGLARRLTEPIAAHSWRRSALADS